MKTPRFLARPTVSTSIIFVLVFILLPLTTHAALSTGKFVPLTNIPGLKEQTIGGYMNALFILLISVGAMFAVVKIAIAGVRYMLSDVVTDKGAALNDIRGALIGLLILLASTLALNTINPDLTNLNVLQNFHSNVNASFPSNNAQTATPTTNTNGSVDLTSVPANQRQAVINQVQQSCASHNDKAVVVGDSVKCLNQNTNTATYNTVNQFNQYADQSQFTTDTQKTVAVQQYNEYVASQQPKQFDTQALLADPKLQPDPGGKTSLVFVVNNLQSGTIQNQDYVTQQNNICHDVFNGEMTNISGLSYRGCIVPR